MAKTGETPDRKPKTRSRASRPSFTPAAPPASGSAWVYRSDAEAPKPAPADAAVAQDATKTVAKTVTRTKAPRRAPAPSAAPAATGPGGVTHALDLVTMPIAVSLMAVLAPMRWLLGPRH